MAPTDRTLRHELREAASGDRDAAVTGEFTVGCHDDDFWRRMLPAQARFVGRSL
jgi:hypothetical protein